MSVTALGTSAANSALYGTTAKKKQQTNAIGGSASQNDEAAKKATLESFLAAIHMNPVERLRAAYLKSHGLTEEQLAAKSPEERQKIEDDIKREIEEKLKREAQDKALKVDLLV